MRLYQLAPLLLPLQMMASELVVNGSFETGNFTGWNVAVQPGSTGDWLVYSGTTAPISEFTIPAPPEGHYAAVCDQFDVTSAVLYQDVTIPKGRTALGYTYYYRNLNGSFDNPPTLDIIVIPNQQVRIDIMDPASAPFSVSPSDVLLNLLETPPGSPINVNPTMANFDISEFAGRTIRIRFADADNQFFLTFGVDGVSISTLNTTSLHGNNRSLAKYLIADAPIDAVVPFSLLNSGLAQALESAAPTRNAFTTYASQNAYLASSQTVTDHLRQRRFHRQQQPKERIAVKEIPADMLMAFARNIPPQKTSAKNSCQQDRYTVWVSPFGEYAREKSQNQSPAFRAALGGAVAAIEYNGTNENVVGFGAAYAYTHIHEKQNAGNGDVNQGFLTAYGTLNASKWYVDLGIWGGYYHTKNRRHISFPGVNETAKSHTHGWQLAPHFEVGYEGLHWNRCAVKEFGIEPFLIGDWVANWERGLHEHGAGVLNMGQKGRFCSLIRGETGIRFHEIVQICWGQIVFREKISYAYQKAFRTGSINAFLVGAPGSFTVNTLTGAQNLGVAEFSVLFVASNSKTPYIDLRYQGEFGSRYQSHQGIIEIGKDF